MNDEIKMLILNRIEHLKKEVEHGKSMINNPFNGKFWSGRVASIEGYDGELEFLQRLMEEGERLV